MSNDVTSITPANIAAVLIAKQRSVVSWDLITLHVQARKNYANKARVVFRGGASNKSGYTQSLFFISCRFFFSLLPVDIIKYLIRAATNQTVYI